MQKTQCDALPKREENNCFDAQELRKWPVGLQEFFSGDIEQQQAVESQCEGNVAEDHQVHVAVVYAIVVVVVYVETAEDQCEGGKQGPEQHELQHSDLDQAQKLTAWVEAMEEVVEGPGVLNSLLEFEGDREPSLASHIIDQQHCEAVDHEGLVAVPYHVEGLREAGVHQAQAGCYAVQGNH